MKATRCAVYTRKSTEDGLEQEFNSLDAQREACEAYILSQKHEGWELVDKHYDDGGFSGGNMDRPGLQALLADVEAGLVNVIVVYKVDRLTRSLADFAKIVERLDEKEASFVSVTQAFNTTTSMGRLTLNVLLSFAQFEREVTGERIRDKIAAAKKKGIWMGGPVPLGYQVIERKLVPHDEEARQVRYIMRRYLALPSVPALLSELENDDVRTKKQKRTSGPHRGGIPFKRGSLFHLLKNPTYRGMIVHKGNVYQGEHDPIVNDKLWNAVQTKLQEAAPPRKSKSNTNQKALLAGLLVDPEGRPMVTTFTCKGSRRYRYYETRRDLARAGEPKATRFSMRALDRHIINHLQQMLGDEHALRRLVDVKDGAMLGLAIETGKQLVDQLESNEKCANGIKQLLSAIAVKSDKLELSINGKALGIADRDDALRHDIPLPAQKPFREAKLRLDAVGPSSRKPDAALVNTLRSANEVQRLVFANPDLSINQLAKCEGRCRKQMTKLLRISWLSPSLVEAILEGRQPKRLTRTRLLATDLPIAWNKQQAIFGGIYNN